MNGIPWGTTADEDAKQREARAGLLSRTQSAAAGGKSDEDKTDDFDRAERSKQDRIRRLREQADTYGQSAEPIERSRVQTDLLTAAKRAERDITPDLTAQIQTYAS